MVVGRRRVAAASVATAYALYTCLCPPTPFSTTPNRPAIPPSPNSHPHCRKVGAQCSHSGYFSWVLVLPLPPPPPLCPLLLLTSLFLSHSKSFRLSVPLLSHGLSLDPSRPFQPSSRTYSSRIRMCSSFLLRATRQEAPGRTVPYYTSPSYSGLSPSIHPLLTFSFFCSDFLLLFCSCYSLSRLGPSQRPILELK